MNCLTQYQGIREEVEGRSLAENLLKVRCRAPESEIRSNHGIACGSSAPLLAKNYYGKNHLSTFFDNLTKNIQKKFGRNFKQEKIMLTFLN